MVFIPDEKGPKFDPTAKGDPPDLPGDDPTAAHHLGPPQPPDLEESSSPLQRVHPENRKVGGMTPPPPEDPAAMKPPTMGLLVAKVETARDLLMKAEEDIHGSKLRLTDATTRFNEATKHLDEAMRNLKLTAPSSTNWANSQNKGD